MKTSISLIALVAAVAAPVVAHAAEAAATTTADADQSTTVVITGDRLERKVGLSRLPADTKDIAQSVTVLDKDLLQSQGVASLADALKNVPGITLGGAEGGQIGNNINLNGFAARTDIYLDGFRDRGQYYRDTFDLESVEVLMGPSSMLFGRGSTGGAINQVTKKPTLDEAASVSVSATTNGLGRVTADVNHPISPTAALRIDLMAQDGAASTRDVMKVKDYGIAPSFKFGIHTPTEVTLQALYQHNNDMPDYGVPPLNGHPATDRDNVYGYSDDRTIQDVTALSASVEHHASDAFSFRDQLQVNEVRTNALETAPQGIGTVNGSGYHALTPAGVSNLPLDQLWVRLQSHDRVIRDTSLYNQAEVTAAFGTGYVQQTLLAGLEFGHDKYRNQGAYRNGTCNGVALGGTSGYIACVPLLDPPYVKGPVTTPIKSNLAGGEADTAAAYVNDTFAFGDQFKLVAGLRYDRYKATITNSINSTNTPGSTAFARVAQTVDFTSVRLGGIWQPNKASSYYLSYSTSFNPSLEQLTSTTGISQPLPPEDNKAWELGGKWEAGHDRLSLNAAAFSITKDNARSQNADNTYSPDGTVRVEGFRLGAAGKITDAWQVFGGYTYLDARIVKAIAAGTQGKVPGNTARDQLSIWTTFDVAPHWQVGGGAVYLGPRFVNNTDVTAVKGYTRWDATIAWKQPKYDVRLNLFNLFDTKYYDALIQSDGGRSVPGTGRTAMISLNWHM